MKKLLVFMLLLVILGACTAPPGLTPTPNPTPQPAPTDTLNQPLPSASPIPARPSLAPTSTAVESLPATRPVSCQLSPAVAPAKPAVIPGYTELDETTGLHMTGIVTDVDLATYRLKVTGKVKRPLSLSYDELRCMPKVTATPKLICQGFFEDVATWSGVPLNYVLGLAGVQSDAETITMLGADNYYNSTPLADALLEDNFLAYEWEGQPVPILHGFPLRAVFPTMLGNKWVKWLIEIQVK